MTASLAMSPGSTIVPERGVRWSGAQRDVLAGDLGGHVDLSPLSVLSDLYGLGPLEGARGEVSIFRGVPSIARVEHGVVVTTSGWAVRACFLVWAQVPVWHTRIVDAAVTDLAAVEEQVVELARERGIDAARPFPFHVAGLASHATLHVLDKRDGLPHTVERHEQAKVRQRLVTARLELIGFYSRHHRGVFTPGDSNLHVHGRTHDGRVSGHLEAIALEPGARIGVPEVGWIQ